jgi:hypothetical protein
MYQFINLANDDLNTKRVAMILPRYQVLFRFRLKMLNTKKRYFSLRFYTSSENQDFKTCSGIEDNRLVKQLPPDSDTPIQFMSKEVPLSYSNGGPDNNSIMSPKDKKQYGNMAGNYGPYGPPIYQQPQLPVIPYQNGYSFSNQLPYSPYFSPSNGDVDNGPQQQIDPSSYSYSNGLAYYPSQGPEVEATTLVQPSATSSSTPAASPANAATNKKLG